MTQPDVKFTFPNFQKLKELFSKDFNVSNWEYIINYDDNTYSLTIFDCETDKNIFETESRNGFLGEDTFTFMLRDMTKYFNDRQWNYDKIIKWQN